MKIEIESKRVVLISESMDEALQMTTLYWQQSKIKQPLEKIVSKKVYTFGPKKECPTCEKKFFRLRNHVCKSEGSPITANESLIFHN